MLQRASQRTTARTAVNGRRVVVCRAQQVRIIAAAQCGSQAPGAAGQWGRQTQACVLLIPSLVQWPCSDLTWAWRGVMGGHRGATSTARARGRA